MRSIGALLSALALVATAGCTSSLGGDATSSQTPSDSAASTQATPTPTPTATSADEETEEPTTEASEQAETDATDSAIEGSETHGKLLLTSAGEVANAESLHGKIVVGRGGCIAFVPIPEGGRPLALIAPQGSSYDGRDHVTIGDDTYHFGEMVDLMGAAEENGDYAEADRCGNAIVRIAP